MLIIISCSGVTINVKAPSGLPASLSFITNQTLPTKNHVQYQCDKRFNSHLRDTCCLLHSFLTDVCLVQVHPPWKTSNTLCKAPKSTEVKWPQKSGQFLHLQLLLCVSETTSSTTGFLTWVYIKLGQIKSSQNGLTCCITNSNIRKSQR